MVCSDLAIIFPAVITAREE